LKIMGFTIKENTNRNLNISFFGEWNKFDKKFAFLLWNEFNFNKIKNENFKIIEKFCLNNNYKIIIICNKEVTEFIADTYKVLNFKHIKKFNKDITKMNPEQSQELQKIVI